MKVLDLFSGIGGFSIGLEKFGFETVAFCEIEPYCRGVLERHWPDTPIYGDVKQLTGEQLKADGIVPSVIVGGYPCQPFSTAGNRKGEQDPRHLWPEVHRLIRELRPRWVICENVGGHIKLGLDEVLSALEGEGYAVWTFVIPACGVDAPHKRDRVWIVANSNSSPIAREGVASGVSERQRFDSSSLQGGGAGAGLESWPAEPDVCRVVNGIPNQSHRLKALGNAIVPQIAEAIGHTIMRYEREWLI
jgi:DNA (cytosine-5)-methyltransferase 1